MYPELRKKYILDFLDTYDSVSVNDVALYCKVTAMTIRRDFDELEAAGKLVRVHGRAVKPEALGTLYNFDQKATQNKYLKELICKKAATLINDNDIIFIDCGTTLSHLAKNLSAFKNLLVITNSLPVVTELLNFPNIKVNIIGGEVDTGRKAIYGPLAEKTISSYYVNKAFIGADGISVESGLSSYDVKESAITLCMAQNADKVILITDSSKIGKVTYARFASIDILHTIVTDHKIDHEMKDKLIQMNIQVITN
ncbi:MAG: DeoR/GlpR family DNA-binding transcription regulator [Cytophagales bacterium]|nr:DeoR/GlpR family DNA-binding transcription regulator [Cytophagales bacterium]